MNLFIVLFLLICKAEDNLFQLWLDVGCTPEGALNPNNNPYFWESLDNSDTLIHSISKGKAEGDPLSTFSCIGKPSVSIDNKNNDKFHLLWECQNKHQCELPYVHSLCLMTLRNIHPSNNFFFTLSVFFFLVHR